MLLHPVDNWFLRADAIDDGLKFERGGWSNLSVFFYLKVDSDWGEKRPTWGD